jgi:hypothetical protein
MIKFHNTSCKVFTESENVSHYIASFKLLALVNIEDFILEISPKSHVGLNVVAKVATQNLHFEHKEICVRFEVFTVPAVKSVTVWV